MTRTARSRRLGWLSGIAVVALSAPPLRGQTPTAYTLEAPPEIRALLKQLRDPDKRDMAIATLVASGKATPYLKFEHITTLDANYKDALNDALAAVESQLAKRNKDRAATWLKEKRIDMCVEFLVACQDDQQAIDFIDNMTPMLHDIGRRCAEELKLTFRGNGPRRLVLPDKDARIRDYLHLSGDYVSTKKTLMIDRGVIRADTFDSYSNDPTAAFVAVRSKLQHPNQMTNEWINSIVLANCSIPLRASESSLIISDGDVEFGNSQVSSTVVIARGNILAGGVSSPSGRIWFSAGGTIALWGNTPRSDSVYVAGGPIPLAKKAGDGPNVREKQTNALFGLRFLDLAEFGVEVEAVTDGVKVTKVAVWSPLATHDLKPGDVIRSVNDAAVNTPATFRHQIRRAILLDYALLRCERDGKRMIRIVFLDGIPIDPTAHIAPPPR